MVDARCSLFQGSLRVDSYDNFVTSDRDHTPFNLVDQEQEDLRGTRYVLGLMTFFSKNSFSYSKYVH